jgi:hypothetical protein
MLLTRRMYTHELNGDIKHVSRNRTEQELIVNTMTYKIPVILLAVCFFGMMAHSESMTEKPDFSSNPSYNGRLVLSLDKLAYSPGENVSVSFVASNLENFSIIDAFIVVHAVSGGQEHIYPTQFSDDDNVFYEYVIKGVNLGPFESKSLNYSYMLPSDLRPGTYRLESYFETERTPIVGMAAIFLAPASKAFSVGGNGNFPQVKILRNSTMFNNRSGPVGVGAQAGSNVRAEIFFQNNASASLEGYRLVLTVCEWQDMVCPKDAVIFQKVYDAPKTAPGAVGKINLSFSAPEKSGAFSVRLELQDRSGRLQSLYRSRIVVLGPTGRIRKMVMDPLYLEKGDPGRISLLIGASPDHYTYPGVENVKISASITDKSSSEIYSGSKILANLSVDDNGGLVPVNMDFIAARDLAEYKICSSIESSVGVLLDKYCLDIDPSKYSIQKRPVSLNATWDYDSAAGELIVNVCGQDSRGKSAYSNITILLISREKNAADYVDASTPPCANQVFKAGPGIYTLAVNDRDSGRQYSYELNLADETEKTLPPETTTTFITSSTMPPEPAGGDNNYYLAAAAVVLLLAGGYILMKSNRKSGGAQ